MPANDDARQRLKRRLSRTVVYTAPLMIAVTGAASLHAIISDVRDGVERQPSAGASQSSTAPAPEAMPEGMPEGAPEAQPEAMPEASPEAMPEAMPEGAPEGGY